MTSARLDTGWPARRNQCRAHGCSRIARRLESLVAAQFLSSWPSAKRRLLSLNATFDSGAAAFSGPAHKAFAAPTPW